jgi:TatD DNase family protein
MLIDSHCHLSQLTDSELHQTLEQAKEFGVSHLVAIGAGYGFEDNPKTLSIAQKFDHIVCALALHPHDASLASQAVLDQISTLLTDSKVRAVGEVGLDYHYLNSPREDQIQTLIQFIEIAKSVKKPLVIHDRECGDECVNLLKEHGAKQVGGMIHCFSGDQNLAKKYLDLGFYVSFSGIVTFKKAQEIQEVAKTVPLDRMLVETDSPFLAPIPHRGKPNQPAYVKFVAEKIAELRNQPFESIADITTKNAKLFFGISDGVNFS